jgi:hypothetical protein
MPLCQHDHLTCILPANLLITIIFLFAAFGPMRGVCGRIAVFDENIAADGGDCAFVWLEASLKQTQNHTLSP